MADLQQEKIADAEEVLRYLTSVIRGEATEEVAVGTPIGTEIITKDNAQARLDNFANWLK